MKISIIIPAHDEEKRIGGTLKAYSDYFESLRKKGILNYELLIVINNTKDKTETIVLKFQKRNKNIKYLNFKQSGKGFAIIEGFKEALKDKSNGLIGFVDADNATSPEFYYDLIKNIGNSDGIMASRYLRNSIVMPKQSFKRIVVSRIFNFLIRILFLMPYADTQCGAKIFRKEAVGRIINKIGITRWAFDIDLLYQLRKENFKIREFPTVWSDKEYSKLNVKKAGVGMVLAVIRLRLLNSPMKDFVRFYDKMPNWLKIYHKI